MEDQQKKPIAQWFVIGILALTFLAFPIFSTHVGLPADEPIDLAYGEACLDFYTSGGQDTSFANLEIYEGKYTYKTQRYYGGLFEMATIIVSKVSPLNIYKTRHFMVGICGALIALFTVLIAYSIGGWTLALIALLILLSSISFMGQAMYNTKDIPFALGMTMATHYFIVFIKDLPRIRVGTVLGAMGGVALAMGIRIGGLLLFGYLGIFMLLYYIKVYRSKDIPSFFTKEHVIIPTLVAAVIAIGGALLGLAFYPNFWLEPTQHIIDAIGLSSKFPVKIAMLFEGERILSTQIPDYYLYKYLYITTPLLLWVGLGAFVLLILRTRRTLDSFKVGAVAFAALFPMAYVLYANFNLYNGWRHVSFLYPPLVLLSGIGLYQLHELISHQKPLKIGAIVIFAGLTAKPFAWAIANHPYEYIYFNELVGKKGVYIQYDTDYQQIAALNNLNALKEHLDAQANVNYPITVYTNNEAMIYQDIFTEEQVKIQVGGIQGLASTQWNYAIMSSIFLSPHLFDYVYPPFGAIINVEQVDDYPISYLTKRENYYDVNGLSLIRQNNFGAACPQLMQAYQYQPKNYQIWVALGYCYLNQGDFKSATAMADGYLGLFPGNKQATKLKEQIQKFSAQQQGR